MKPSLMRLYVNAGVLLFQVLPEVSLSSSLSLSLSHLCVIVFSANGTAADSRSFMNRSQHTHTHTYTIYRHATKLIHTENLIVPASLQRPSVSMQAHTVLAVCTYVSTPRTHTSRSDWRCYTHTSIFFLTYKPFNLTQTWRLCPIPVWPLNLGTKVDLDDNVWGTQNWRGGGQQWGGGMGSKGGVETKICARKTDFCAQQTDNTALLSPVLSLLVLSSFSSPLSLHPYPRESVFLPESAKGWCHCPPMRATGARDEMINVEV